MLGTSRAATEVTGIRLWDHGSKTRFVLEAKGPISFSYFTLDSPYRIVIDLNELNVTAESPNKGAGLVQNYRYGLFRPGNTRFVLDLSEPAKVKSIFILPPKDDSGYRLVADLVEQGALEFEQTVGVRAGDASSRDEGHLVGVVPVTPVPKPIRNKIVVVLDPGHGGIDPGAISGKKIQEKAIVLEVARKIRNDLRKLGDYEVKMTRETDTFLSLRDRVKFARRAGADLFISIHADTIANSRVRGAGIYTLSEKASDKEAEELAAQENKTDILAGVQLANEADEVTNILIDLAQRESKNLSVNFTQLVLPELEKNVPLRSRPHRFAGFRVLKAPDVPSVLIELGFMSNKNDRTRMTSEAGQEALAHSIANAVHRYFQNNAI